MLLCVSAKSKHPKEAAELAWFVTSPENQLDFARIVSILPSTPASLTDPHFAFPKDNSDKTAYARALSAGSMKDARSFVPTLPAWPEMTAVFNEQIKAALLDGADVSTALKRIGMEWNGILDSHLPATMETIPHIP